MAAGDKDSATQAVVIGVEVVYGLPQRQKLIALEVPEGCTALEAVERCGIVDAFPEIDTKTAKMGIFSKPIADPASHALRHGDRVEIYRPLLIDPKEMRRRRAEEAKARRETHGGDQN